MQTYFGFWLLKSGYLTFFFGEKKPFFFFFFYRKVFYNKLSSNADSLYLNEEHPTGLIIRFQH